jgi:hypothetical protein
MYCNEFSCRKDVLDFFSIEEYELKGHEIIFASRTKLNKSDVGINGGQILVVFRQDDKYSYIREYKNFITAWPEKLEFKPVDINKDDLFCPTRLAEDELKSYLIFLSKLFEISEQESLTKYNEQIPVRCYYDGKRLINSYNEDYRYRTVSESSYCFDGKTMYCKLFTCKEDVQSLFSYIPGFSEYEILFAYREKLEYEYEEDETCKHWHFPGGLGTLYLLLNRGEELYYLKTREKAKENMKRKKTGERWKPDFRLKNIDNEYKDYIWHMKEMYAEEYFALFLAKYFNMPEWEAYDRLSKVSSVIFRS